MTPLNLYPSSPQTSRLDENGTTFQTESSQNTITPPALYLVGLFAFYGSLGMTFYNMTVLEEVTNYRILIATLSGAGFLIAYATRGPAITSMTQFPITITMFKIWFFYAIYLTLITYVRSNDLLSTIYAGSTFYYMILSMLLAFRHIEAGYDHKYFWIIMSIMGILGTSINLYFARFSSDFYGESELSYITDMRSQVISGSSMILIAIGFINISKNRTVAFSFFLLSVVLFLYVVSKTRSVAMGVILVVLYAILVTEKRVSAIFKIGIVALISLIIAYLIPLYLLDFDIFQAWSDRVNTEDVEGTLLTFYTRLAEYKAQFLMLTADFQSAIFGFGYLETMIWDPAIWDMLYPNMDPQYYYMTQYVGQHSTWINSLFQGGFILGAIPFLTFTFVAYLGFRKALLPKHERAMLDIYGLYGCGIIVYLWPPSFFGMFLLNRLSVVSIAPALIYGVYGWERFKILREMNRSEAVVEPLQSPVAVQPLVGYQNR